ncbi:MAG: CbiX/SirB N-terminal domain-containing protein, partial [Gemmatimonadaceae bacterium]
MRAILLIDHGSVRAEANHMLSCVANLLQQMVGESVLVRHSHMELAEPSIAQGFAECVSNGATEVIAFPYMLSPGKHVTRDIPRLVQEAAQAFPQVSYR